MQIYCMDVIIRSYHVILFAILFTHTCSYMYKGTTVMWLPVATTIQFFYFSLVFMCVFIVYDFMLIMTRDNWILLTLNRKV